MTFGEIAVLATPMIICGIGALGSTCILFSQQRPPRGAIKSSDRRVASEARRCLEEMDAELTFLTKHLEKKSA